jgi:hypothetical protein
MYTHHHVSSRDMGSKIICSKFNFEEVLRFGIKERVSMQGYTRKKNEERLDMGSLRVDT